MDGERSATNWHVAGPTKWQPGEKDVTGKIKAHDCRAQ
jgi:hypothetical protein